MTVTLSKKSGKGMSDGVISEITAFLDIKPGHVEQVRAAIQRFATSIDALDPKDRFTIGIRQVRVGFFDNDQRLLWAASFETDWDPYIDDAVRIVGSEIFTDIFQHMVGYPYPEGSSLKLSSAQVKELFQSFQVRMVYFHDALSTKTIPEFLKAVQVERAFEQVLDNPEAAQALEHPALKPLLEQAAD